MQDSAQNPSTEPTASADAPAPAEAQVPTEGMPSLAELLRAAELKSAEHHDAWLRAKAETENVRRRAQEDVAKAYKFASEKFAGELLSVIDSLEAALANDNQTAENLHAGVELTLRQLNAAFEKSNLVAINPLGEKFDPHKHQAMTLMEAADDKTEPNHVISVLQKGYMLNERILRPAMVVVSKAKGS
ncbi:MAG: nucleotide exchange factor GrpE [Sterolibacterium sp.]|nr:nucleotide exchange factor GrpE [Sterolibacterium sp.]